MPSHTGIITLLESVKYIIAQ
jgi:hypothetical protein